MSRDYLNPEQEWCFKGCFNCGEEGHKSGECPNPDDGGRQGRDCSEDKGYQSRKPMEAPYVSPSLLTDGDTLFSTISTGIKFDKYDVIPVDVSDPQFRMSTNFNEMSL
ncbi:hypothetical protein MRX96_056017 [Rhipicephalus microplus]